MQIVQIIRAKNCTVNWHYMKIRMLKQGVKLMMNPSCYGASTAKPHCTKDAYECVLNIK